MKLSVKEAVVNAMIACVYVVLTLAIEPFAYGAIQMRISEVMVFLAFYNRKYIPGLVIGCFVANMFSTMGVWDMIFGTLATLIVCIAMYQLKNLYLGAIVGGLVNGIIVGIELTMVFHDPFYINFFYVFVGEVIALLIGAIIFKILEKNENFMKKFILE